MKNDFISVRKYDSEYFKNILSDQFYHIFLLEGIGSIKIDFTEYDFSGKTIFFTSPFQNIQIFSETNIDVEMLNFHGDFYCIEFHKKEVACNGLLFNNIYLFPHFVLKPSVFDEIRHYFLKIKSENFKENFNEAVLRAYLQLILAICSKEKNKILLDQSLAENDFKEIKSFQALVEKHFLNEKNLSFYAGLLHIAPNTLSKKIKQNFNKTPSKIIHDRVILEAKRKIHLTRKSIKEIALELNFSDEFYFSKYFKKHTGISPSQFRKEGGISIVADFYR